MGRGLSVGRAQPTQRRRRGQARRARHSDGRRLAVARRGGRPGGGPLATRLPGRCVAHRVERRVREAHPDVPEGRTSPRCLRTSSTRSTACWSGTSRRSSEGLLRALGDAANRPLVFHCTQGKDRAGFGAAMVLSALGVPWETVVEDYLLSNHFRKQENDKMLGMIRSFCGESG